MKNETKIGLGLGALVGLGVEAFLSQVDATLVTAETIQQVIDVIQKLPPLVLPLISTVLFGGLGALFYMVSGDRPPTGLPRDRDYGSGGRLTPEEQKARKKNDSLWN